MQPLVPTAPAPISLACMALRLEAKQASKPWYLRYSIKPITVHNPSTRRSARVTVNLATTAIALGTLSIAVPDLSRVGFVMDFTDGTGTLASTVDLSVIDRTIQAHNPVVIDCQRSVCMEYETVFGSKSVPVPLKGSKPQLTNPPLSNQIESSPQYQLYKETNAYNKWHSFGQQQAQRWQRQRDWEYISRVQRNSLSGPQGCYATPTGVACFRNTRNFNYY